MRGFTRKGEIDWEPLSLQDTEKEKHHYLQKGNLLGGKTLFFQELIFRKILIEGEIPEGLVF